MFHAFDAIQTRPHMPIYEYKCPKCGVFEVMQGIKQAALKKCPTCKSKIERMISSTSFVLKGTGWYATDYAKKTPPSESAKDGKETAANGKSGDSGDAAASKTESEKTTTSTDSKSTASTEKPTTTKKADTKSSTTKSTD
jgi:putative FmdB family regulatory protein